MSDLGNNKPFPAQYVDNGHGTALRKGLAYVFDAHPPAIAPAGVIDVRFVTGNSAIIFESGDIIINQEEVLFEVYEDTIFTSPGTITTDFIRNMNRIVDIPSEIQVYNGAVVDTIGELVVHQLAVGQAGQNVNQPGFGSASQDSSFVLKPNTEHVFRITNNSILAVTLEAHYFFHQSPIKEYR